MVFSDGETGIPYRFDPCHVGRNLRPQALKTAPSASTQKMQTSRAQHFICGRDIFVDHYPEEKVLSEGLLGHQLRTA